MKSTGALLLLVFALVIEVLGNARAGGADAQQKAEAILKQADAKVASLRDFTANVKARAHVPLLPAFDLTGKVYFKRPNHLKVDMGNLPRMLSAVRHQLETPPPYQNRKLYAPRYLREEACDGQMCDVIAFEARDPATRLQSATIWLERGNDTIPHTELRYSSGSSATMNTTYTRVQSYFLPHTSNVHMQTSTVRLEADVTYSDYLLNTNLPDSVFVRSN